MVLIILAFRENNMSYNQDEEVLNEKIENFEKAVYEIIKRYNDIEHMQSLHFGDVIDVQYFYDEYDFLHSRLTRESIILGMENYKKLPEWLQNAVVSLSGNLMKRASNKYRSSFNYRVLQPEQPE